MSMVSQIQVSRFFSPNFRLNKEAYLFWMLNQGYIHRLNFIIVPYSQDVINILKLTHTHGIITGFQLSQSAIKVFLKWPVDGTSAFHKIKTLAKPSKPHQLKFQEFLRCHLHSCAITPIWIFQTRTGYTDQYALYKHKIGGNLVAIIT